jgi:hypothetical protein
VIAPVPRRTLDDMPHERRQALVGRVAELFSKSGFRHQDRWRLAIAIMRGPGERSYVTSRVDAAAFFKANDLPDLARQCLRERTKRGEVLLFVDVEDEGFAFASLIAIDLAAEVRAVLAAAESTGATPTQSE